MNEEQTIALEEIGKIKKVKVYNQAYVDKQQKRISELEKENAELKERLEHRNCVDCSNHGSSIKLLKAKEIIKELMKMPILLVSEETKTEAEIEEFFKQAEDFIAEGIK